MGRNKIAIFAAAVLSLISLPAKAEMPTSALITKKIDRFVTSHAGEFVDDKLTPGQVVKMKIIAHQAAVAATCDDFTISEEKFLSAFSELAHEQEDEMSEAEKDYFERHLLVTYGVMVGGALAVAAPDPAGFCEDAAVDRAETDIDKMSVWE